MSFVKNIRNGLLSSALIAAAGIATVSTATPAAAAPGVSKGKPANEVVLSIGRSRLISLPSSITDIFVADERIADVQVKSTRQIFLLGKQGGETTVYATNRAGKVVYSATVRVGKNIDSVDQMLMVAMPDAKISVNTMNGFVLLTGSIASPDDGAEAERLVQAFVGEGTQVISRLKTATPLQVNLRVRIAEVSRSLAKEIGGNLLTRDKTGGFQFGVSRGRNFGSIGDFDTSGFPQLDASNLFGLPAGSISLPFNPQTGQFITGGTAFNFNQIAGNSLVTAAGRLFGIDVAAAFDVSERAGLTSTLAQPNLTTVSGETATFLAGGEFPIPVSQGNGATSVEFRKFGVSLTYTPTVLANGRISMRVAPEVSELSSEGAVRLNGFEIPAVTTRSAETTVELGSGQSFMIAGLMSNRHNGSVDKTPGLGDVPILGNLFKSDGFRRNETELMIVITPYLVKPVSDSEIKLPTDGFRAPTDLQRLIVNQQSDGITGGSRPMPKVAPTPPNGPELGSLQAPTKSKPKRSASARKAKKTASATPGFSFD